MADTHLNICAVLSQLGRHSEALKHCESALRLIQRELFRGRAPGEALPANKAHRIAVLAITFHNLGAENEHLRRWTEAIKAYTQGVEVRWRREDVAFTRDTAISACGVVELLTLGLWR